jgi:hypothetical protein
MPRQATATTSNHPIPINYSHGYGITAMVGAVKLQWPSEVWITCLTSTEQVQLHPHYVGSACPATATPVMPMMAEMVRLALRSISLMEARVSCPIFWDRVSTASRQLVEDSQIPCSECRGSQPMIESPNVPVNRWTRQETAMTATIATTWNHLILMNYSHGYGTIVRVGAMKSQ